VKLTRISSLVGLATATVLLLAACGSDNVEVPPAADGTTTSGAANPFACATGNLRSSGSTAQGKAMEQWILDFNDACSASITPYGGGGSGKGITDFTGNQVDFAGSDSALNATQAAAAKTTRCAGADALNLPLVTGPIALAYNVPGVSNLVVDASALAKIFSGTVTKWNDPALTALNAGVALPDLAIQPVHRAEDSGTTENFTKYLKAAAAADWKFDAAKAWPSGITGGIAANGSDGVAQEVKGKEGTIGYVEWGFATDNKLSVAKVDNGSGTPVELTGESAGKAVAAATVIGTGKDLALKLDYATKAAGAYPIILVTYEIVCSANNGAALPVLKSFLGYAATKGQATLAEVGAAPLPAEIQTKVVAAIQGLS
jgi:phosphate transport system substrate-binding protein